MSKIPTPGNQITVRKNTGADVGTRPRLNLIEGANVTLTVLDDGVSNEVDITVAAAGGGGPGTGDYELFFEVPNPDVNKGAYTTQMFPDDIESIIRITGLIPSTFNSLDSAYLIVIPDNSGNMRWSLTTYHGAICSGVQYDANTDSVAERTDALTSGEIECLDISAALTNIAANHLVGFEIHRHADDVLDTINDVVHCIGITLKTLGEIPE